MARSPDLPPKPPPKPPLDPNRRFDRDRYERDRTQVESDFWDKLRRTLGRIPFAEDALAAYYCARDPDTPLQVKAILMGALAYFIVPADMLPDVIALLGFTDDAAVLAAALRTVMPHVKERHHEQARGALKREAVRQDHDEPVA